MRLGKRCKHGLYCECFICNFENQIAILTAERDELQRKLNGGLPKASESTEIA